MNISNVRIFKSTSCNRKKKNRYNIYNNTKKKCPMKPEAPNAEV